jgi:NADPH:quinone reductase-like Zn-dependent oxidoreductase
MPDTMKAIVYTEYGPPDVLRLEEVAKPTPRNNELLIRIHATTVTAGDVNARGFTFMPPGFGPLARIMFGLRKPKKYILGTELAGEIDSVGRDVSKFQVGDQVFALDGFGMGCYAEYRCMPEDGTVALKPPNLTYEEAAALSFGGTTALGFLRRGKLQGGQRVLINGASGGVGTAAVQLAKHFEAEVTGVCSAANVELVKSLGADHVIDYTKEDFTQGGETYDLILDTVVGKTSFSRCKASLKPEGRYLAVAGGMPAMVQMLWTSLIGNKKVIAVGAAERAEDLRFLAGLAETGEFKPVIDRRYPLEQMAEAHRYVETRRKKGNVVITIEGSAHPEKVTGSASRGASQRQKR